MSTVLSEKRINHYLGLAKNASEFSDFPQHKLGAVLIEKNRVVSVGFNSKKENPIQKHLNKLRGYDVEKAHNSLHAEVYTLLKAKDLDIDWNKTSLFIYRQHKDGRKALAKPCAACSQMIKQLGIKNIYYTGDDSIVYERVD